MVGTEVILRARSGYVTRGVITRYERGIADIRAELPGGGAFYHRGLKRRTAPGRMAKGEWKIPDPTKTT